MRRRIVVCTLTGLAVALVVTWLLLRGSTWTFSFTQTQLEAELAKRFPMHKTYLLVIGVHYENPRVRLTEGSDEVGIGLDVRIDGTVNGKPLAGSADLVSKIAYDAATGTFVLHDALLTHFTATGLDEANASRVKKAANLLAAEQVSGVSIYRLRPTDVKAALARLVLRSVAVRDGVLHVTIGV
jgi:hypothetical protein